MKRLLNVFGIIAVTVFLLLTGSSPIIADGPLSMEGPDGQGLLLDKLSIRLAMHGPLSLTEMEMLFRNPRDRQLEGKFSFTLPPGAAISRFAKEINGKLMEGEVVERKMAARVYTEILHTMRDPALLEQDQGNVFKARIFPIAAHGTVRLILSYSRITPVDESGFRRLNLPLKGIQKIQSFELTAICRPLPGETVEMTAADGHKRPVRRTGSGVLFAEEISKNDFEPANDIVFVFKASAQTNRASIFRAGHFQMISIRPDVPPVTRHPVTAPWSFFIDTSASEAKSAKQRLEILSGLLRELRNMNKTCKFRFSAFDLDTTPLECDCSSVISKLESRHFLGGTDLVKAVTSIGANARKTAQATTFVLVTDGIPTFGSKDAGGIVRALGDFPGRHTLHLLVIGSSEDETITSALAEAGHGRVVRVPITRHMSEEIVKAAYNLCKPAGVTVNVYDESAEWLEPSVFHDVLPGRELIAFAKIDPSQKPAIGISWGKGTDSPVTGKLMSAPDFAPLLERQAYRARLRQLERKIRSKKAPVDIEKINRTMLDISINHRVLCPLTSLLVLENENDYRRFGIYRRGLADLLVVGDNGIELKKRHVPEPKRRADGKRALRPSVCKAKKALRSEFSKMATADDDDGGVGGSEETYNLSSETTASRIEEAAPDSDNDSVDVCDSECVDESPAERARVAPSISRESQMTETGRHPMARAVARASCTTRPGILKSPSWVSDAFFKPDQKLLKRLNDEVSKNPRDRMKRNSYCWALSKARKFRVLIEQALDWQLYDVFNPMVYEFLGDAFTACDNEQQAIRAYSSIAEVSPGNSSLLNRAGYLLLKSGMPATAAQIFRFAIARRPDHHNNYRGLALALWYLGRYKEAANTLRDALKLSFNSRYSCLYQVLREELGYVLRAYIQAEPSSRARAVSIAKECCVNLDRTDALRITLHWETDANDVDLHTVDPANEECFYSHKNNASGLRLYADLTQGLGPEVMVVPPKHLLDGPYHIGVKYFSSGPMGVSRGIVLIQRSSVRGKPQVQIETFCLLPDLEGNKQDMRHIAVFESCQ